MFTKKQNTWRSEKMFHTPWFHIYKIKTQEKLIYYNRSQDREIAVE